MGLRDSGGATGRTTGESGSHADRARPDRARPERAGRPVVAGVPISHADRVMYPEPRLTKLDLARYYEAIADRMLPHVVGRPLTLVRCGEGVEGPCAYMRHAKAWGPSA